ncbi:MAG: cellulase N-terminal Ig-like domain-containing protein, partial [Terriglobia bacterium]
MVYPAGAKPAQRKPSREIHLNGYQYFAGPGFSFLLFHNHTFRGQYGLQMIENGDRVIEGGDLVFDLKPAQRPVTLNAVRRVIDPERQTAVVYGKIQGWSSGYQFICHTDGKSILITLKLDSPIDWSKVQRAGVQFMLDSGVYFSKFFASDKGTGSFPRNYRGESALLEGARIIRVAPGDPMHGFTISRSDGTLDLVDSRAVWIDSAFKIFAPITLGSRSREIHLVIQPSIQPQWRRAPVIEVSQVGYEPSQAKRAILELDPRESAKSPVRLYRIRLGGSKKLAKSGIAKPWGRFLRFNYAIFDFSDIRQPGLYLLRYANVSAGPFRIAPAVYDHVWEPTLEYFLPAEMCHVEVREGTRVWHGACHLDDALQAPAGKRHIDGYNEGPDRE